MKPRELEALYWRGNSRVKWVEEKKRKEKKRCAAGKIAPSVIFGISGRVVVDGGLMMVWEGVGIVEIRSTRKNEIY